MTQEPTAAATVELRRVSKWYGDVVAVAGVSFTCGPGVTGLLGPNGAGKTTTFKLLTGLLQPSMGETLVFGRSLRHHPELYRSIGVALDGERLYQRMTAFDYVRYHAALHGLADPEQEAEQALRALGVASLAERRVGGFSKGERQRVKVAAAIVDSPALLVLDEPMSGMDPVQRASLIRLVRDVADAGATVVVSSHILEEVEQLASRVLVLVNGRLAASGDVKGIRALLAERRPYEVAIRCDGARALAADLVRLPTTVEVRVNGTSLHARTRSLDTLALELPRIAREREIRLDEVSPSDESLEDLFHLLVER